MICNPPPPVTYFGFAIRFKERRKNKKIPHKLAKICLKTAEIRKIITFLLNLSQNSCRLIEYFVLLHSKY